MRYPEDPYPQRGYIAPSIVQGVGYILFVLGVVAPSWRLEIGYVYGLWVRCDEGVCKHSVTGFTDYQSIVRLAMMIGLLLLSTSTVCLLLEYALRTAHASHKHVSRLNVVLVVSAASGELISAVGLGLYGCKTVMAKERFPSLSWGYAVTGIGVITCLLGSILRAMGHPSTWGSGICCMAPTHQYKEPLSMRIYVDGSEFSTPEDYHGHHGNKPLYPVRAQTKDKKVGLISCFHKTKKGYSYSSFPSTVCSTLERGYRHYEEISFEEMPPPPLELLNSCPAPLSHIYHHDILPAYPYDDHNRQLAAAASASLQASLQNTQVVSVAYPEPQPKPQSRNLRKHQTLRNTDTSWNEQSFQCQPHVPSSSSRNRPVVTPRQTTQRSQSAKTSEVSRQVSGRASQTVAKSQRASRTRQHPQQLTEQGTRYQTMPVQVTRETRGRSTSSSSRQQYNVVPNTGKRGSN